MKIGVKMKKVKDTIDTKAIEEKALNHFKSFIEDSKVISQFIADNDKEPCWDGHLYLYADGIRDKEHLQGRVPIQIKGTEVGRFVTKKWKFKLEKADLKAYLEEPTFFIVCQVKKDSKERMLFFRELLPDLVNKLLRDMGKNATRMTLFHPLTEDLKEFEDQLMVFLSNSKKMISFAHSKLLSMEEALKKGIKDFSFIAPLKYADRLQLMKYLSTHSSYIYAKISKELDVDMPLSNGPGRFIFQREDDSEVRVGDKVYFKGYHNEIKDGRIIIKIGNVMTINMPMDNTDMKQATVKLTTKAKYLKESINEAEFGVALNDTGGLSVGMLDLQMKVHEKEYVEELRQKLIRWKELDNVLETLHVTKPFDLTAITDDQGKLIDLLIETVGKGNMVNLPGQEATLLLLEIGNIELLLWCAVGKDGMCAIGDFFDRSIRIAYKISEDETINVSPYSYLQLDKLWEKVDNIDFDNIISSAEEAARQHKYCYMMSNYDVLAMITAADALEKTDVERSKKLLEEASKLNDWLIGKEPKDEMRPLHIINKMQIMKRQRELTADERQMLEDMLNDEFAGDMVKAGVYLLLDRQEEFQQLFETMREDEKKSLKEFPIWRFVRESEGM
ncbi:MAG: hypothetical protein K2N13_07920 [Paraprevotella sp.]|nr:hypothetical protein [Paraprevotella sp.]